MPPELLQNLRAAQADVRTRWEALLRIERVSGPLANPDALVHLIPDTLEEVLTALGKVHARPITFVQAMADRPPGCECGCNPYLAYFIAGEQALVETVVLLQTRMPRNQQQESDVAEVIHTVRAVARQEIDTFCGICTHRSCISGCRFPNGHARAAR